MKAEKMTMADAINYVHKNMPNGFDVQLDHKQGVNLVLPDDGADGTGRINICPVGEPMIPAIIKAVDLAIKMED